jgi:hypothetical protein
MECHDEEYLQDKPSNNAATQTIFETSTKLYPIGPMSSLGTFYDNMGIRLNATYRVQLTEQDRSTTPKDTMRTRLKSHICDLTGAVVNYDIRLHHSDIYFVSQSFVKDL